MTDHELLLELAEWLRSRFYGKYRGTVIDNDDPAGLMRLQVSVPAVLGATANPWAMPCVPYAGAQVGLFLLPDAGAGVWVEFEGGDVSYPVWTGCYWHSGEVPSDAGPQRRGLVTAAQAKLLFDDGGQTVSLGDRHTNALTLGSNGVSQTCGGSGVTVASSSVSIRDGAFQVS